MAKNLRLERLPGPEDSPALSGPFRILSRTAGVRSSNTCTRSNTAIDVIREQSEKADYNFGGGHQR